MNLGSLWFHHLGIYDLVGTYLKNIVDLDLVAPYFHAQKTNGNWYIILFSDFPIGCKVVGSWSMSMVHFSLSLMPQSSKHIPFNAWILMIPNEGTIYQDRSTKSEKSSFMEEVIGMYNTANTSASMQHVIHAYSKW